MPSHFRSPLDPVHLALYHRHRKRNPLPRLSVKRIQRNRPSSRYCAKRDKAAHKKGNNVAAIQSPAKIRKFEHRYFFVQGLNFLFIFFFSFHTPC